MTLLVLLKIIGYAVIVECLVRYLPDYLRFGRGE